MTQTQKSVSPYIGDISSFSLPCGTNVSLCSTGNAATCGASDQTRNKGPIDLVDFSPPDSNQQHMTNLRSSISLVKSSSYNLISHSGIVE